MLGLMDEFKAVFIEKGVHVDTPEVIQTLTETELVELIPAYDGWIAGDDPVSVSVLDSGNVGQLKVVVKWGVGVDNVDFEAAKKLGISVAHTPNMFGSEVADIAISYLIGLAREIFWLDREVRNGGWPKPRGISLKGKTVGLIGYGDIGKNIAERLVPIGANVIVYDPAVAKKQLPLPIKTISACEWPDQLELCDFLVFCCSLNKDNYHMLNQETLNSCKQSVRVVNVARGGLIDERALIGALESGKVHSAALDVFEIEPLPEESKLRTYDHCIFGSHNSSNTFEAVRTTSHRAMGELFSLLNVS